MKDGFNAALADERRKINIRQADLERRENQLKTKLQDAQRYFEASGLDAMILEFRRLARLGKAVSQLEELAAGNLHGEVCEGETPVRHSTGSPLLGALAPRRYASRSEEGAFARFVPLSPQEFPLHMYDGRESFPKKLNCGLRLRHEFVGSEKFHLALGTTRQGRCLAHVLKEHQLEIVHTIIQYGIAIAAAPYSVSRRTRRPRGGTHLSPHALEKFRLDLRWSPVIVISIQEIYALDVELP